MVGTVLNLLNNAPGVVARDAVSLWRVLLNGVLPSCVSSASAARNPVDAKRRGGTTT